MGWTIAFVPISDAQEEKLFEVVHVSERAIRKYLREQLPDDLGMLQKFRESAVVVEILATVHEVLLRFRDSKIILGFSDPSEPERQDFYHGRKITVYGYSLPIVQTVGRAIAEIVKRPLYWNQDEDDGDGWHIERTIGQPVTLTRQDT